MTNNVSPGPMSNNVSPGHMTDNVSPGPMTNKVSPGPMSNNVYSSSYLRYSSGPKLTKIMVCQYLSLYFTGTMSLYKSFMSGYYGNTGSTGSQGDGNTDSHGNSSVTTSNSGGNQGNSGGYHGNSCGYQGNSGGYQGNSAEFSLYNTTYSEAMVRSVYALPLSAASFHSFPPTLLMIAQHDLLQVNLATLLPCSCTLCVAGINNSLSAL